MNAVVVVVVVMVVVRFRYRYNKLNLHMDLEIFIAHSTYATTLLLLDSLTQCKTTLMYTLFGECACVCLCVPFFVIAFFAFVWSFPWTGLAVLVVHGLSPVCHCSSFADYVKE